MPQVQNNSTLLTQGTDGFLADGNLYSVQPFQDKNTLSFTFSNNSHQLGKLSLFDRSQLLDPVNNNDLETYKNYNLASLLEINIGNKKYMPNTAEFNKWVNDMEAEFAKSLYIISSVKLSPFRILSGSEAQTKAALLADVGAEIANFDAYLQNRSAIDLGDDEFWISSNLIDSNSQKNSKTITNERVFKKSQKILSVGIDNDFCLIIPAYSEFKVEIVFLSRSNVYAFA